MAQRKEVVGFNLETGERMKFGSVTDAAEHIVRTRASANIAHLVNKRPHHSGWLLVDAVREDELKGFVETWRMRWAKEWRKYKYRNCGARGLRKPKKVALRVDAKTVIMVTPDKATEEYAAQWRARHDYFTTTVQHSTGKKPRKGEG